MTTNEITNERIEAAVKSFIRKHVNDEDEIRSIIRSSFLVSTLETDGEKSARALNETD